MRWWVAGLVLSVFGPYIFGGVRTEQLVVYGSAALAALLSVPIARARSAEPVPALVAWTLLAGLAITGAASPPENRTPYAFGSLAAGIDNLILPFALMVLTWWWVSLSPNLELVGVAARWIVVMMTANAALTLLFFNAIPAWFQTFWTSDSGGDSVAARAATMGRYTGVFNQPAEAGIAYSLGLFCLVYVIHTSEGRRSRSLYFLVFGMLLTVGGILTTSKIFLLGGLPVAVYLVLRNKVRRTRLVAFTAIGALSWVLAALAGILPTWSGAAMITRLLGADGQSLIRVLTAGRLGDGGTLSASIGSVVEHNLFFGVGAQGLAVAYDSGWVEAFIVAGAAGIASLALVFAILLRKWWRLRLSLPRPEWMLGGAVVLLALGGSVGIPSLTGNRIATLLWVMLGLLVTARSPSPPQSDTGSVDCAPVPSDRSGRLRRCIRVDETTIAPRERLLRGDNGSSRPSGPSLRV